MNLVYDAIPWKKNTIDVVRLLIAYDIVTLRAHNFECLVNLTQAVFNKLKLLMYVGRTMVICSLAIYFVFVRSTYGLLLLCFELYFLGFILHMNWGWIQLCGFGCFVVVVFPILILPAMILV